MAYKQFKSGWKFLMPAAFILSMAFMLSSCDDGGSGTSILPIGGSSVNNSAIAILEDGDTLTGTNNGWVMVEGGATINLVGTVVFTEGSVLMINPGAKIKADTDGGLSNLIIDRGAKIFSMGTAADPVLFTSEKATEVGGAGAATADWGGIVINGKARINAGATAEGEGNSGTYGGTDDEDNSGVIRYTRIQFGGYAFTAENELNTLCLQGVGSRTVIDYVQTHMGEDDGIEMFGGTVNLKHVVSTGNKDDQIDCTFGWRGKIQFAVAAPLAANGDSGFEYDNSEDNYVASPKTSVAHYNVTFVRSNGTNRGARWRRGTSATMYNAYFAGAAADRCFFLEDPETRGSVSNTLVEACGISGYTTAAGAGVVDATLTWSGTNVVTNAPATPLLNRAQFVAGTLTSNDLEPNTLGTNYGGVATVAPPNDGFFDTSATFTGAVENGANNWLDGWTSFPAN